MTSRVCTKFLTLVLILKIKLLDLISAGRLCHAREPQK